MGYGRIVAAIVAARGLAVAAAMAVIAVGTFAAWKSGVFVDAIDSPGRGSPITADAKSGSGIRWRGGRANSGAERKSSWS